MALSHRQERLFWLEKAGWKRVPDTEELLFAPGTTRAVHYDTALQTQNAKDLEDLLPSNQTVLEAWDTDFRIALAVFCKRVSETPHGVAEMAAGVANRAQELRASHFSKKKG